MTSTGCIPLHITEERHLLFKDHFVLTKKTIQSCQKKSVTCQRLPRWMTFYPETEFRRSIDVGVCSGQCGDSMMCKAVWTRSKAIATPNGEWHHSTAVVIISFKNLGRLQNELGASCKVNASQGEAIANTRTS